MKVNVTSTFSGTLFIYPSPKGSLFKSIEIAAKKQKAIDLPDGDYRFRLADKEVQVKDVSSHEVDIEFHCDPINQANVIKLREYQKRAKRISAEIFKILETDGYLITAEHDNGDALGNAGSDLERAASLIGRALRGTKGK